MNFRMPAITMIVLIAVVAWGATASVSLAADNRGRGAPADDLPRELKNTRVKDWFLPGKTREAGVIQTVLGHVIVARDDLRQAFFAASGDKLHEQDIIFSLPSSKCRMKLLNNDVIILGDSSRLTVREVAGNQGGGRRKTGLSLVWGKAMFYAIHLFSDKGATMTVESPNSVATVMGAKFGMEIAKEGEGTIEILPVIIADASGAWGQHLLPAKANPPPGIATTVHGFDGTVRVASTVDGGTRRVGAGQSVSVSAKGIGDPVPTPALVSRRFQSATSMPPPGAAGVGSH
jgi:hypothetical protein